MMAFVFFGPVAVGGTVYLQTGHVSLDALGVSVPVGCLVTAIMVVNNLRDIPTDRATGKRTLAVRIGARATRYLYTALVGGALCALLPLAYRLSPGILLALLALPLAAHEVRGVWQREGALLNHSLAGTARLLVVTGTLLVVGLLW
jgi:1,4-dihydroxy-2-naphthoate octaprenyltransferase